MKILILFAGYETASYFRRGTKQIRHRGDGMSQKCSSRHHSAQKAFTTASSSECANWLNGRKYILYDISSSFIYFRFVDLRSDWSISRTIFKKFKIILQIWTFLNIRIFFKKSVIYVTWTTPICRSFRVTSPSAVSYRWEKLRWKLFPPATTSPTFRRKYFIPCTKPWRDPILICKKQLFNAWGISGLERRLIYLWYRVLLFLQSPAVYITKLELRNLFKMAFCLDLLSGCLNYLFGCLKILWRRLDSYWLPGVLNLVSSWSGFLLRHSV